MKCLKLSQILRLNPLILTLLFLLSAASPAAELFLKERAEVKGDRVLLKEIAQIKGSSLEEEILGQIPVATSPSPCRKRFLTKREVAGRIASYLERNRVSFKEIAVKGAPQIEVYRPCTFIDGERVKRLIESYLKENYPDVVLISAPSPSIRIPESSYREEVSLDSMGRGYARFVYKILSPEGKVIRKLWIPVRIDRKVKAVEARVSIPRGTLITKEMVKSAEIPSMRARGAPSSLNEVVGKVARRDILPGEVIKERDLVPNFVVKKGKPVKVVYDSGPIHIELLGVALDSGAVGNIIRVKNVSTGKILRCRVEEDGSAHYLSE